MMYASSVDDGATPPQLLATDQSPERTFQEKLAAGDGESMKMKTADRAQASLIPERVISRSRGGAFDKGFDEARTPRIGCGVDTRGSPTGICPNSPNGSGNRDVVRKRCLVGIKSPPS